MDRRFPSLVSPFSNPWAVIREESGRHKVSNSGPRHRVRTGGRKKHRRFPGPVSASNDADRIVKGDAEILDPANAGQLDLREKVRKMGFLCLEVAPKPAYPSFSHKDSPSSLRIDRN